MDFAFSAFLMLPEPAKFAGSFFLFKYIRCILFRNKLHGLYRINPVVLRFADPDFAFHKTMFFTIGYTVIMLSVWCEPPDLLFQVAVAQIAFGGRNLLVSKKLLLIRKIPGDILGIIIKDNMNLFFFVMRHNKAVKGYHLQYLGILDFGQYASGIIGIAQCPVKWYIFGYGKKINRIFQIAAGFFILKGKAT